jgi:hypothetical protein
MKKIIAVLGLSIMTTTTFAKLDGTDDNIWKSFGNCKTALSYLTDISQSIDSLYAQLRNNDKLNEAVKRNLVEMIEERGKERVKLIEGVNTICR